MAASASLAESPTEQAFDTHHVNSASSPRRSNSWRSLQPSLQPPLPPLLACSSSPRHHSSASASAAPRTAAAASPASPPVLSTPDRRYRRSPTRRHSRRLDRDLNPSEWGDDSADISLVTPAGSVQDPSIDHHFLGILAEGQFSSPSSYPSFFDPLPGTGPQADEAPSQLQHAAATDARCELTFAAPSRTATHLSLSSAGDSQNALFSCDFGQDPISSESAQSSFAEMPPTRLRDILNAPDSAPATKARRMPGTGGLSATLRPLALPMPPEEHFFDGEDGDMDELPTIDLTEANGVPEELKKPAVDNRVKISALQCVICMDDVTTLTVTHCGHLYCQQCLHSSLHVDSTRGKCPMCRAKIDMKPRSSYSSKTKGFWPLELKLTTAAKKGKRKADAMS